MDHSLQLSDAKDDEIRKIALADPNSFLHIFDYTQNSEVKGSSTIETINDKVFLCLRAQDAETFSRLNHEIDQIDRMWKDLQDNRKEYFEKREEEELFKYDSVLKLEDINGTADRKILSSIKLSQNYKKGKAIGAALKKAVAKSDSNMANNDRVKNSFPQLKKRPDASKMDEPLEEENSKEGQSSDSDGSKSDASNKSSSGSSISNPISPDKKADCIDKETVVKKGGLAKPSLGNFVEKEVSVLQLSGSKRKSSMRSNEDDNILQKPGGLKLPLPEQKPHSLMIPGLGLSLPVSGLQPPKPQSEKSGLAGFKGLLLPPKK